MKYQEKNGALYIKLGPIIKKQRFPSTISGSFLLTNCYFLEISLSLGEIQLGACKSPLPEQQSHTPCPCHSA